MKYLDEFRDPDLALRLIDDISRIATKRHVLMEVCGGQTHSIIRNGIDRLLPDEIEMVHGPGCPVCVTPLETIDKALAIASRDGVIFCSFGDMLRVPGSGRDLFSVKSAGGDVRIVYSPLDAVKIARDNPDREVVFFGIGFETTAPANAMAVYQAKQEGLTNFSMLVSHVLVPPAMRAILDAPTNRVEAFLAAGHVCSVMGYDGVRPDRRAVRDADRCHRLRATRSAPRDQGRRSATRRGSGRGGERVPASGQPRWQRPSPRDGQRRVHHDRPELARHRHDPPVGLGAGRRVPILRRRRAIHRDRYQYRRVSALPRRRGAARHAETRRVPGLRQGVHTQDARSERRWCRPREPAPPTTCTGDSRSWRRHRDHRKLVVPDASARSPVDRDGPRRRWPTLRGADRASLRAGVR